MPPAHSFPLPPSSLFVRTGVLYGQGCALHWLSLLGVMEGLHMPSSLGVRTGELLSRAAALHWPEFAGLPPPAAMR